MMMIKGIGIDIEDMNRFRHLPYEDNKNFYEKIFTKSEIEYCIHRTNPYQHFAVRFCAKEAVTKSLGKSIDPVSIEIQNGAGIPSVHVEGYDLKFSVSLSHTHDFAIAIITATTK